MKIKIVAVGNLKDKYAKLGVEEYKKRITRFSKLEIVETAEENFVKSPSDAEIKTILLRESKHIEKELEGGVIVMDINGKKFDSIDFSKKLDLLFMTNNTLTFVIGGSYGLDKSIKDQAILKLSFSDMTFPHGLFRLMAVEQIYRALAIRNNLPYHK